MYTHTYAYMYARICADAHHWRRFSPALTIERCPFWSVWPGIPPRSALEVSPTRRASLHSPQAAPTGTAPLMVLSPYPGIPLSPYPLIPLSPYSIILVSSHPLIPLSPCCYAQVSQQARADQIPSTLPDCWRRPPGWPEASWRPAPSSPRV